MMSMPGASSCVARPACTQVSTPSPFEPNSTSCPAARAAHNDDRSKHEATMSKFRGERDSMGEMQVPAEAAAFARLLTRFVESLAGITGRGGQRDDT